MSDQEYDRPTLEELAQRLETLEQTVAGIDFLGLPTPEFHGSERMGEQEVVVNGGLSVMKDLNVDGVSIHQMAETVAIIDARTTKIDDKLNALIAMTARMPDGRTLINVVGTILHEVQND